ncbi:alcohol dehydrogenase [Sulfolobus sp. S-194]|uniref:alcohol dehydrogenase catalytic domain-containing protein n=1 Tax=Sulfolobus sp. S-194 TaxID=2512240 RepID=UPI001436E6E6|nr:alcohol dehydrogenase catalytic domain-containing protein [Sulfolobus sp. S-194]QIW23435.1 alcohol dehydrogenase [Sulfolobus sp. S-194]
MKAAVFREIGKPLSIEDVPLPRLESNKEVLLKVRATGVCHGDLHLIMGDWQYEIPVNTPIILGHEIVGEVVEGGTKFQKGDLVMVYNAFGCKECKHCKAGYYQFCERVKVLGVHLNGGFAEYVKVPDEDFLMRVEGNPIQLAPLADAGVTAYSATRGIKEGDKVLVVGTGAVALLAIQILKSLKAEVSVVSRNPTRLAKAEELGADHVYYRKKTYPSLYTSIVGKKFDYIIDFVGSNETLDEVAWLLDRRGELRIVGEFGGQISLPEQLLVLRGLKLQGVLYGTMDDMKGVINLYNSGKLKTLAVPYYLDEINDALNDLMQERILGRAVIIPS